MTAWHACLGSTMPRRVLALLIGGMLSACVHQEQVTTRPEYAFPQHMTSLCGKATRLLVSNRGEFVTGEPASRGNGLLLSAQLSGAELATQRLISLVEIEISADRDITAHGFRGSQRWLLTAIPADKVHCADGGELLLDYPADSFYFWASVGKKERLLALWSNNGGDLVMQHRWREEHRGLVSGSVSGDAWALFKAGNPDPMTVPDYDGASQMLSDTAGSACSDLSGDYLPDAEVVYADGSLDSRRASDQFFREALLGDQTPEQDTSRATVLRLDQDEDSGIVLSLYEGNALLGSRMLPQDALDCRNGRWLYRGDKRLHSAWLLLAASGGFHWEDLELWRDTTGALVVQGRHSQRALLLLIPFGSTQTLFMAFPPQAAVPQ